MIDIEEYILLPKNTRQAHLDLAAPCIDRGCNSEQCRGLLAHVLDTNTPKGGKIILCHACNNASCSNPNHLYWGTSSENYWDARANGKLSLQDATIRKYGEDGMKRIRSAAATKRWHS